MAYIINKTNKRENLFSKDPSPALIVFYLKLFAVLTIASIEKVELRYL